VAGEHEVLPDHQPHLVAEVVEPVRLVPAPAPDADHVHVGVTGRLQEVAHALRRDPARKGVGRDPVGAPAEDVVAVDADAEGGPGGVRLGHEADVAQADAAGLRMVPEGDGQVVERLLAEPCGPPETGGLDPEARGGPSVVVLCQDGDARKGNLHRLPCPPLGGDADRDVDGPLLVHLRHPPLRHPRRAGGIEPHLAVKPEGRERDVPVPAEVALRLAEHVAVRDRAVPRVPGHEVGLRRLCGVRPRRIRVEGHLHLVRT
jgi:hypothetical protein